MAESFNYLPNGCKHHSDCFSCPFDDCINGEIVVLRRIMHENLMKRAQKLLKQGRKATEIAPLLGVTVRTIYRYQEAMKA